MGTRASDEEDVWGEMKEVTKMETSGCEVCVGGWRNYEVLVCAWE